MATIKQFIDAQNGKMAMPSYKQALAELSSGSKNGHWIWYILPQIQSLGHSKNAKFFGIKTFAEACDYLQNKILFDRYCEITKTVLRQLQKGTPLLKLMGSSVDTSKLLASLTLFRTATRFLLYQGHLNLGYAKLIEDCDKIFNLVGKKGYSPCKTTLTFLKPYIEYFKKPTPKKRSFFNIKPVEEGKQQELSSLSFELANYIVERNKEWSFHYNFLGIMSLMYWLVDLIGDSDYFNNKSKEIKINAATILKENIDNKGNPYRPFLPAEKEALRNDRLGDLVNLYGGIDEIEKNLQNHESEQRLTIKKS
ncbi:MAG: DUF1810 family protein [Tatlockia sp.]|nr:DUF1810 family protein [Tatlockia sp.]